MFLGGIMKIIDNQEKNKKAFANGRLLSNFVGSNC